MANVYTSALEVPSDDFLELLVDRFDIPMKGDVLIEHYTAANALVGVIVPPEVLVENGGFAEEGTKTRIRVYLAADQVPVGEKIKISIDSDE